MKGCGTFDIPRPVHPDDEIAKRALDDPAWQKVSDLIGQIERSGLQLRDGELQEPHENDDPARSIRTAGFDLVLKLRPRR